MRDFRDWKVKEDGVVLGYKREKEFRDHHSIRIRKDFTADSPPLPSQMQQPAGRKLCPVPGCRRSVKKLWNHLFQFHKSKGNYTGMSTVLILCSTLTMCFQIHSWQRF